MLLTEEQKILLWLSAAEVPSSKRAQALAEYGSDRAIWDGFGPEIGAAFGKAAYARLRELKTHGALDDYISLLDKRNIHVLFLRDAAYPERLSAISDPPYALYYRGSLASLERPCVSIVGTRYPSAYGRDMARSIAGGLASASVCVVSGMAKGIDGCAHEGALAVSGLTMAVLGSGLLMPYPAENVPLMDAILRGGGAVMSEYPPQAGPSGFRFPHRNRLIAGLSRALVFVEGRVKSGGMITVSCALAQGREVFAVPGRAGLSVSEGPHTIIREGARLVTCADDILEDMGLKPLHREPEGDTAQVTLNQAEIIACLSREPMSPDQLAHELHQSPADIHTELGVLEIMGHIRREAGGAYAAVSAKL